MAAPISLKSVNQYSNFESNLVMLSEAEKEMAAHSSILAWRTPRTEETGRLQSMGLQRVRNNCATHKHTHTVKLKMLAFCQWQISQNALAHWTQKDVRTYVDFIIVCDANSLVWVGRALLHPFYGLLLPVMNAKEEDTEILHISTWNGPNILIHMEPILHISNTADRGDIHK